MYIIQLSAKDFQFLQLVYDASFGLRMGTEAVRMGKGVGRVSGCMSVCLTAKSLQCVACSLHPGS